MSSVNVSPPYLRISSGGPHARSVQEQLQRLKFLSGGMGGIFGQQTEQAVRVFQRGRGIDADGMVGPDAWGRLPKGALTSPPSDRWGHPARH